MPHVVVLGTLDSKLKEFQYLHDQLLGCSLQYNLPVKVTLIDCGRSHTSDPRISITSSELVERYGAFTKAEPLMDMPRGDVIKFMIDCAAKCVKDMIKNDDVHAIISAGGSGGTSLASAVMRQAAPIGMPKLIVSTVASGDTGPIVGESDITMMYSVVDVAGSNTLLRNVLSNAAGAILGMAISYEQFLKTERTVKDRKARIGVTMFGVTTPCVNKIREHLEERYDAEVFVFHATGHGGRAMESLIEERRLDAVLDVTTTEICDVLMDGNMSAGPNRLEAALRKGIPNILSLGATGRSKLASADPSDVDTADMVNFGPRDTVPTRYDGRKLFEHNPTVTLMRTTGEECRRIGEFIVSKITSMAKDPSKVQIWIPRGGVSMISTPGGPFEDSAAAEELASVLKEGLKNSKVRIVEDDRDVNNEGFAIDLADEMARMLELGR